LFRATTTDVAVAIGMARLLAVDWGTSVLRAALLDDFGAAQLERTFERGMSTIRPGDFGAVFRECLDDWFEEAGQRCLVCGMAGARSAWQEVAYRACPASADELAAGLGWVDPGRIAIVPGAACEARGVPDVMRGEETQVLGALDLLGLRDATLVLPGTHSKWVTAREGRIVNFSTHMTGEVFALLRQRSLLSRSLPAVADRDARDADDDGDDFDSHAFDEGVAQSLRGGGLLHNAFSVRTLSLFDRKSPGALLSRLSGLVIGEELLARPREAADGVILVGTSALTVRYARALAQCGVASHCLGAQAGWRGLHVLAKRAAWSR
jgi:2-dehydro-3-deoxygalactonokinase